MINQMRGIICQVVTGVCAIQRSAEDPGSKGWSALRVAVRVGIGVWPWNMPTNVRLTCVAGARGDRGEHWREAACSKRPGYGTRQRHHLRPIERLRLLARQEREREIMHLNHDHGCPLVTPFGVQLTAGEMGAMAGGQRDLLPISTCNPGNTLHD
jgi:hypothetical protein